MTIMAVTTYTKKAGVWISDHFISDEFDCPCTNCNSTLVAEELIALLEKMRTALGQALRINSGYRCKLYQLELAARRYETATGISQHQLGNAADIMSEPKTGLDLEKIARDCGFKAVGVGGTWVHCDTRDDKERRWEYRQR